MKIGGYKIKAPVLPENLKKLTIKPPPLPENLKKLAYPKKKTKGSSDKKSKEDSKGGVPVNQTKPDRHSITLDVNDVFVPQRDRVVVDPSAIVRFASPRPEVREDPLSPAETPRPTLKSPRSPLSVVRWNSARTPPGQSPELLSPSMQATPKGVRILDGPGTPVPESRSVPRAGFRGQDSTEHTPKHRTAPRFRTSPRRGHMSLSPRSILSYLGRTETQQVMVPQPAPPVVYRDVENDALAKLQYRFLRRSAAVFQLLVRREELMKQEGGLSADVVRLSGEISRALPAMARDVPLIRKVLGMQMAHQQMPTSERGPQCTAFAQLAVIPEQLKQASVSSSAVVLQEAGEVIEAQRVALRLPPLPLDSSPAEGDDGVLMEKKARREFPSLFGEEAIESVWREREKQFDTELEEMMRGMAKLEEIAVRIDGKIYRQKEGIAENLDGMTKAADDVAALGDYMRRVKRFQKQCSKITRISLFVSLTVLVVMIVVLSSARK